MSWQLSLRAFTIYLNSPYPLFLHPPSFHVVRICPIPMTLESSLTKKELEDTMRTMLAPPGAGGFGGPDGESALDRFTRDLTMVARQVWKCRSVEPHGEQIKCHNHTAMA